MQYNRNLGNANIKPYTAIKNGMKMKQNNDDKKKVPKAASTKGYVSSEKQKGGFEKFVEEIRAKGFSDDEGDLNDTLKRGEIFNKWFSIIELLSHQALEKYNTIDITNEQMADLFIEGLKQYRPIVNLQDLRKPYSIEKLKENLQTAIDRLIKNEAFLLKSRANERSLSHKLAEYLQTLFPNFNVDCEYNKKGLDTKVLDGIRECSEQKKTDRVYPDIIIHKRNYDNNNLMVIEIKTISEDENCDFEKLKRFTRLDGKYEYQLGVFIRFQQTKPPIIKYYQNGEECEI